MIQTYYIEFMDINERIRLPVNHLFNKNDTQFSTVIHKLVTTVNNILSERKTTPSSKFLASMHNSIENISLDWILNGVGSMLKEEIKPQEKKKKKIHIWISKTNTHS